jgi:hypothetical protein
LLALLAGGGLGGISRAEAPGAPPRLGFPLACTLNKTCWIQHYVDRDPSGPARDYTCGSLTYGGHNGTDIRIPDMAAERAGVNVLAAAAGRVLRSRDGMADISVRTIGLEAVKDAKCGNGLVIDHGGGWSTQYCHMAKGSLIVHPGDVVRAGQPLGHVGLSGETEFPHLHISVRRDGKIVDPFAPDDGAPGKTCGGGASLWAQTPPYTPRAVLNAGFAGNGLDMATVEAGEVARPDAHSPYLAAYVRTLGLRDGDEATLTLLAPDGRVLAATPPTRTVGNKDQSIMLIGRKRPPLGWGGGVYRAHYSVTHDGRPVLTQDFDITPP